MAFSKATIAAIAALLLCQAVSAGRQLAQAPSTPSDPVVSQITNAATSVLPSFSGNPLPAIPDVASQLSNVIANVGAATSLGVATVQENVASGVSNVQSALPNAASAIPAAITAIPSNVQSALSGALPAIPAIPAIPGLTQATPATTTAAAPAT